MGLGSENTNSMRLAPGNATHEVWGLGPSQNPGDVLSTLPENTSVSAQAHSATKGLAPAALEACQISIRGSQGLLKSQGLPNRSLSV